MNCKEWGGESQKDFLLEQLGPSHHIKEKELKWSHLKNKIWNDHI
jgi:hypothetical protein